MSLNFRNHTFHRVIFEFYTSHSEFNHFLCDLQNELQFCLLAVAQLYNSCRKRKRKRISKGSPWKQNSLKKNSKQTNYNERMFFSNRKSLLKVIADILSIDLYIQIWVFASWFSSSKNEVWLQYLTIFNSPTTSFPLTFC